MIDFSATKAGKLQIILNYGLGIYYVRSLQEEIAIEAFGGRPTIVVEDRNYRNAGLEEAGAFTDLTYEFRIQPRMMLGLKTQFFFTISTGSTESITLFPFLRYTL